MRPRHTKRGTMGIMNTEFYKMAIAEAFPQLAIEHIQLDHSGWDNVVVIVNHEIIFRFPRRLEVETRLLPELRKVVSLAVPHFELDRKTWRISGIIDFGDVRIGDPAYDFQFREDYGEVFWQAVLARYERSLFLADARNKLKIDEGFFRKLEFYARRCPFHEILYGLDCNRPERIESGLRALAGKNQDAKEVNHADAVGPTTAAQ